MVFTVMSSTETRLLSPTPSIRPPGSIATTGNGPQQENTERRVTEFPTKKNLAADVEPEQRRKKRRIGEPISRKEIPNVPTDEEIAKVAYRHLKKRNRSHGHDVEDAVRTRTGRRSQMRHAKHASDQSQFQV